MWCDYLKSVFDSERGSFKFNICFFRNKRRSLGSKNNNFNSECMKGHGMIRSDNKFNPCLLIKYLMCDADLKPKICTKCWLSYWKLLLLLRFCHPEILQWLKANKSFNKLLSFTNFLHIRSRFVSNTETFST